MDQLPRLGKRELICLLLFTCNYVVSVWRGFLFLWVLGMGYVILLWHSLSLPYNYFGVLKACPISAVGNRFDSRVLPLFHYLSTGERTLPARPYYSELVELQSQGLYSPATAFITLFTG